MASLSSQPPPPSSCVSLGGCRRVRLAVTKPFRICVRAGSVYSLGDGKRKRKEAEGGGRKEGGREWMGGGGSSSGWHCKRTRCKGFLSSSHKQAVRNGWLHQPKLCRSKMNCSPDPWLQNTGPRNAFKSKGKAGKHHDLLEHIKYRRWYHHERIWCWTETKSMFPQVFIWLYLENEPSCSVTLYIINWQDVEWYVRANHSLLIVDSHSVS